VLLEARDLFLAYNGKPVIRGISIALGNGDFVALTGANGSGKTTILKALSRNHIPCGGMITLDNEDIFSLKTKYVASRIAYLPQNPLVHEAVTVRELIGYGRFPYRGWHNLLNKRDNELIDWAAEVMELKDIQNRDVNSLSGGERQRAWIAMILAQETDTLLLDEPTTFLDLSHQFQIMDLITRINHEYNKNILMVLHDLNQAARFSKRIIMLKDGEIFKEGVPKTVITAQTLENVFHIRAHVFLDADNNCPHFIPLKAT
jgi:iron complex transport system ATP-binding protein